MIVVSSSSSIRKKEREKALGLSRKAQARHISEIKK